MLSPKCPIVEDNLIYKQIHQSIQKEFYNPVKTKSTYQVFNTVSTFYYEFC